MAELDTGMTTGATRPRPISPHLQIYRPMLTMVMSIVHRITGAALYFGMLLLAWWLVAAAAGPNAYASVEWFMGSLIGQLKHLAIAAAMTECVMMRVEKTEILCGTRIAHLDH